LRNDKVPSIEALFLPHCSTHDASLNQKIPNHFKVRLPIFIEGDPDFDCEYMDIHFDRAVSVEVSGEFPPPLVCVVSIPAG